MSRSVPHALGTLVLSLVLVFIVGCGSDDSPSAAAPELAEALGEVDDALANGNYSRAEKALDQLVAAAEEAARDGEISEADADRITDAAEELVAQLPETQDVDPTDDDRTPAPEETPPADDEDEKAKDEGKDKEKDDKGKEEKEDKDEDAEQNGNGHNSENGPDDGHGN